MTAEEMFEELKIIKIKETEYTIVYGDVSYGDWLWFNKEYKTFTIEYDFSLGAKTLKAIYKKFEELGWL